MPTPPSLRRRPGLPFRQSSRNGVSYYFYSVSARWRPDPGYTSGYVLRPHWLEGYLLLNYTYRPIDASLRDARPSVSAVRLLGLTELGCANIATNGIIYSPSTLGETLLYSLSIRVRKGCIYTQRCALMSLQDESSLNSSTRVGIFPFICALQSSLAPRFARCSLLLTLYL